MARKKTNTCEYFPHDAKPGKTLYMLEQKFGNDGYTFWFKTLEILTYTENHFYDCNNEVAWDFLLSKTRVDDTTGLEILRLLAKWGNIDQELWKNRIIWCQSLVNNLEDVYKRRGRPAPQKPIFNSEKQCVLAFPNQKSGKSTQSESEIPQSKVNESKEDKSNKKNNMNSEVSKFISLSLGFHIEQKKSGLYHKDFIDELTSESKIVVSGAETLEELERIDKENMEDIQKVLKFALDETDFWKNQIVSLSRIRVRMKNGNTKYFNCKNAMIKKLKKAEKEEKEATKLLMCTNCFGTLEVDINHSRLEFCPACTNVKENDWHALQNMFAAMLEIRERANTDPEIIHQEIEESLSQAQSVEVAQT